MSEVSDALRAAEARVAAMQQAHIDAKNRGEYSGRGAEYAAAELCIAQAARDIVAQGGGQSISSEAQRSEVLRNLDRQIAWNEEVIQDYRSRGA